MDLEIVSQTALWTAAGRAYEVSRSDRLFDDPFASALAGPEGVAWLYSDPIEAQNTNYLAIRTRFYDEWMQAVVAHGVKQVVLLGAGMDTRAFRLAGLEGITLWEVDRRELLELKAQRLASVGSVPLCDRRPVAADVRDPHWLQCLKKAGFCSEQSVAWVAEGFFTYLEESTVVDVITGIARTSPSSSLGFDVVSKDFLISPWTTPYVSLLQRRGTPFKFATNCPEVLLLAHGWEPEAVVEPGQTLYGRKRWKWPVMPRSFPNIPRSFLITARN